MSYFFFLVASSIFTTNGVFHNPLMQFCLHGLKRTENGIGLHLLAHQASTGNKQAVFHSYTLGTLTE